MQQSPPNSANGSDDPNREPGTLPEPSRRLRWIIDRAVAVLLFACALFSVMVTAGIVFVLIAESAPFFAKVPLSDFFTDTMWTPLFARPRYGILPLLVGTLVTTLVALTVAIPCGTVIAAWLSEFAPARVRETAKPVLELLAAVPTVVYGYFAVQLVTPALQQLMPGLPTFNMLSAGLVMGAMIIPYVSSLSEDAMRAVPMTLREGSYATGCGKLGTTTRVVTPAALSGIISAYILAISRAVGETMIVAIAAGQQPELTFDPREPAATITAYIAQVSLGDLPHGSIGYQSIFAAGVTLFAVTLVFNICGHFLRKRFREQY